MALWFKLFSFGLFCFWLFLAFNDFGFVLNLLEAILVKLAANYIIEVEFRLPSFVFFLNLCFGFLLLSSLFLNDYVMISYVIAKFTVSGILPRVQACF